MLMGQGRDLFAVKRTLAAGIVVGCGDALNVSCVMDPEKRARLGPDGPYGWVMLLGAVLVPTEGGVTGVAADLTTGLVRILFGAPSK